MYATITACRFGVQDNKCYGKGYMTSFRSWIIILSGV